MANMSYCRFENTFNDLKDCYNALANEGIESLSETERKYAEKLISMCEDISYEFGDIEDD